MQGCSAGLAVRASGAVAGCTRGEHKPMATAWQSAQAVARHGDATGFGQRAERGERALVDVLHEPGQRQAERKLA